MTQDPSNKEFNEALEIIKNTNQSVFLTGKAGAGKTTFLRHVKDTVKKEMVILAPTGVAAINAGGQTIHSFFQLPFGPFVPDDKRLEEGNLFKTFKYSKSKRELMRTMSLLIIDEVSMIRADTIDAIDKLLRAIRWAPKHAFGGVQVLLIGDPFQLSPIARPDEWNLLSQHYDTPFFFGSKVFQSEKIHHIELKKIYRQTDQDFVDLLNRVRVGEPTAKDIKVLDSKYSANPKADDHIILATHNNVVDTINKEKLQKIDKPSLSYRASVTGSFPDNIRPTDSTLNLKVGARVMFIKNDSTDGRYFNGKIGEISALSKSGITVSFENEPDIKVGREVWENIKYIQDDDGNIEEQVVGTFTQYPIRLAWAITVHKSQGLTFDKALLDLGNAFTPGQVYVALSRCTSLDGMILKSKVNPSSIKSDPKVVEFSKKAGELIV